MRKKSYFTRRIEGDVLYTYKLAIFICLEIIVAFSALGYIMIKPISLTFAHVPVLLCAMMLGSVEGAIAGAVFGITSIWKASATAFSAADLIFSPFASGVPLQSIWLSIGCRILFGLTAGILFSRVKPPHLPIKRVFVGLFATFLHSIYVYQTIAVCFPEMGVRITDAFIEITRTEKLLSYTVTGLIIFIVQKMRGIGAVRKQVNSFRKSELEKERTQTKLYSRVMLYTLMAMAVGLGLVSHFYSRIIVILTHFEVNIEPEMAHRLSHLCAQFLSAMMAIGLVTSILIMIVKQHAHVIRARSERDDLTGLLNRGTFIVQIDEMLENITNKGYLLMIDVDEFKYINDTYGHPQGDCVLKEIAAILQKMEPAYATIGRLGGDEFGVYIRGDYTKEQIYYLGKNLCEQVQRITLREDDTFSVSISIGIAQRTTEQEFEEMYHKADKSLYHSKNKGKNYVTLFH